MTDIVRLYTLSCFKHHIGFVLHTEIQKRNITVAINIDRFQYGIKLTRADPLRIGSKIVNLADFLGKLLCLLMWEIKVATL